MKLQRSEWLLLFLSLPGAQYPLDQIRVMKGMFLLNQEGPKPMRGLYDFEPYAYGPFATGVYRDLDALEANGLMRAEPMLGSTRRIFRLTSTGEHRATDLRRKVSADDIETLQRTKSLVTSLTFVSLLQHVYARYPKYAARSVARV